MAFRKNDLANLGHSHFTVLTDGSVRLDPKRAPSLHPFHQMAMLRVDSRKSTRISISRTAVPVVQSMLAHLSSETRILLETGPYGDRTIELIKDGVADGLETRFSLGIYLRRGRSVAWDFDRIPRPDQSALRGAL